MSIMETLMAVLVSLTGSSWVSPENARQSVEFKAAQISGNAGCNQFSGIYAQTDGALKIGPLSITRIACKPEIMKNEHWFLTALANTTTVELSESTLTLKDATGKTLTVLNRKNAG